MNPIDEKPKQSSDPLDKYADIQPLVQLDIVNYLKKYDDKQKFSVAQIPAHAHTGTDSNRVSFSNITDRILLINEVIQGTQAQTAGNYGICYISPFNAIIVAIYEVHAVRGTDGGAVTLDIEKLTGTQAPGAGTSVLASTLSLKDLANTTYIAALSQTTQNVNIATGDRLALKVSGVLTSLSNICVTIVLSY